MKTKEELNALKEEVESLSKKLAELTEEELKQVTGGYLFNEYCPNCGAELVPDDMYDHSFICIRCGHREMH